MDIKEIVLAGGSIELSYKEKHKDWMGSAKIFGFSGGFGMSPKIIVEIGTIDLAPGGRKEFNFLDIDEAIAIFEKLTFREKNLCYKMAESIRELHHQGEDLYLDEPKDSEKVRKLQKEKQKLK